MIFLVKAEAIKIADQFKKGNFSVNIDISVLREILDDEDSRDIFVNTFNANLESNDNKS